MTVKLDGIEEIQAAFQKFGIEVEDLLGNAVRATTLNVQAEAITSIQQVRGLGIFVKRYQPTRMHLASAPGQPPNTDTGRLVGSIETDFLPKRGGLLSGAVFTRLEYGRHLEFGTQKMAARPWLFPALETQREDWNKRLDRAVKNAIRRVSK